MDEAQGEFLLTIAVSQVWFCPREVSSGLRALQQAVRGSGMDDEAAAAAAQQRGWPKGGREEQTRDTGRAKKAESAGGEAGRRL
ncbi:hypothetical protein VFPFJ_08572 [Purpureocillium lilacinum]|uniref:Uncharacterized protein n=1 Tax=Purpureocillium lilacinum TaxID=33203 RepID=A0A179GA33_PURLI|nr:hypothetical protein VFPFJ_08572 [Purpureocillium lilacinum]OAQ74664.1 hypothetical protein VFPBJ_09959 [Purpureocillium lilacinum]OAQ82769.1 hypothetical protein VFPFJ_08572 [Purpureocillium lilacinum]